jgi:hypothetical protein
MHGGPEELNVSPLLAPTFSITPNTPTRTRGASLRYELDQSNGVRKVIFRCSQGPSVIVRMRLVPKYTFHCGLKLRLRFCRGEYGTGLCGEHIMLPLGL